MTWYAQTSALRTRQQLTDLAVVVWTLVWLRVGFALHAAVERLGAPGRGLQDAGGSLEGGLSGAASRAGDLPVVGGGLRAPLDAAADAGRALSAVGAAQEQSVDRLALLLAVLVVLLPVAWALNRWLPRRVAWSRDVQAATALRGDVELLALRAATSRPLPELARLGPHPVGRWRRGEPGAAEALAALELQALGLRAAAD